MILPGGREGLVFSDSNELCARSNGGITMHQCLHTTNQTGASYEMMEMQSSEEVDEDDHEDCEFLG